MVDLQCAAGVCGDGDEWGCGEVSEGGDGVQEDGLIERNEVARICLWLVRAVSIQLMHPHSLEIL